MDEENVIKELEDIQKHLDAGYSFAISWKSELIRNVLAMLKEQEPKQVDLCGKDEWWGLVCACPDCNAEWMTDKANIHFCPNCGRSVKLE